MHFLLIIAFLDDLENMALCLQWLTRAFDQIERHQNDHVRDSGWSYYYYYYYLLSNLSKMRIIIFRGRDYFLNVLPNIV